MERVCEGNTSFVGLINWATKKLSKSARKKHEQLEGRT
jgi:hypothetical protein